MIWTRDNTRRTLRWLVLIGVIAGLAPTVWLRSPTPAPNHDQALTITPLDIEPQSVGAAALTGAWVLTSPNSIFGSYSALLIEPDNRFLAASDAGQLLRFPKPGAEGIIRMETLAGRTERRKKFIDIESLTRNAKTGATWVGFEGTNAIERFNAALTQSTRAQPPQMQTWSANSGPESMVRLEDGRFVVLSEGFTEWGAAGFPGLLFPSDPVEGAAALEFTFAAPTGYRPVDMVQIPDGRALVLVRAVHFGLPPYFTSKILLADPADIAAGQVWSGEVIAEFAPPLPSDNMEGLAVEEGADGALTLWVISDDNGATLQRTLLLRLEWTPDAEVPAAAPSAPIEKARSNAARPS
ncbi:esterase-like activity of phytase family protein [Pontixanthobacter sp.]|uniref:esterase-like activity of phytase family protein n=1 Tax=Pontixanthobacter sp. TaxID=2792078 RepID=UPI003C7DE484